MSFLGPSKGRGFSDGSQRVSRQELLAKAQREREQRSLEKRRTAAALVVQAFTRGCLVRAHLHAARRAAWDASFDALGLLPPGGELLSCVCALPSFYSSSVDALRLSRACVKVLQSVSQGDAGKNITALFTLNNARAVYGVGRFLQLTVRHMDEQCVLRPTKPTAPVSVLLCLLDHSRWAGGAGDDSPVIAAKILDGLVAAGMLRTMRRYVLSSSRVLPGGDLQTHNALMTSVAVSLAVRPLASCPLARLLFCQDILSVPLLTQRLSAPLLSLIAGEAVLPLLLPALSSEAAAAAAARVASPSPLRRTATSPGSSPLLSPGWATSPRTPGRGAGDGSAPFPRSPGSGAGAGLAPFPRSPGPSEGAPQGGGGGWLLETVPCADVEERQAAWIFGNVCALAALLIKEGASDAVAEDLRQALVRLFALLPPSFAADLAAASSASPPVEQRVALCGQISAVTHRSFVGCTFASFDAASTLSPATRVDLLGLCELYSALLVSWPAQSLSLLTALTLHTKLIPVLWNMLKRESSLFTFADTGQADDKPFLIAVLTFFCKCCDHLYLTIDDEDFVSSVSSLPSDDVIALSDLMKRLTFRSHWSYTEASESAASRAPERALRDVATQLVNKLYRRDARKSFCPEGHWEVPSLNQDAFQHEYLAAIPGTVTRTALVLQNIPFVLPFVTRVGIFRALLTRKKDALNIPVDPMMLAELAYRVNIRRSFVFDDGYMALNQLGPELRHRIRITFINDDGIAEEGVDGGGVFKEFLTELVTTAYDPGYGLFLETEDRMIYPNPTSHVLSEDHLEHFAFLGRVAGKALWDGIVVDLPFATFFLSKILGQTNFPNDLPSLDSELAKHLLSLKRYDGDFDDLCLTFTVADEVLGEVVNTPLVEGGEDRAVTRDNVEEYVLLLADYRLNQQIATQCQAFMRGLADLVPTYLLRMFDRGELRTLLVGDESPIDIDDLRAHTVYGPAYSADHPAIDAFWFTVESFTEDEKKALLKFVTSCSRPPLMGFGELRPPFCINFAGTDASRLPSASTCMNLLKLPFYPRLALYKERILYAISSNAGFDLA